MSDGNRFLKGFFSAGSDVLSAKAEAQARQDEIRAQGAESWKRTVYETESRREEQEKARQHDFEIKKFEAGEKTRLMESAMGSLKTAWGDESTTNSTGAVAAPSAPQQAYDHPDAPAVRQYASNVGLDENLALYALNKESSKSNPMAVSPKGAEGPMQVMPKTQGDPGYGVTPAKDGSREELRRIGVEYLSAMKEKYGDDKLALIAYNFGPGNTDKWLKETGGDVSKLPEETQNYIKDYGNQKKTVGSTVREISQRLSSGDIRKSMQGLYDKKGNLAKQEAGFKAAGLTVDLQSPVQSQIDAQNLDYEAAKKSEEATLKARQEFVEKLDKEAQFDDSGLVTKSPFYTSDTSLVGTNYNKSGEVAKKDYANNLRVAEGIFNDALISNPDINPKVAQEDVVNLMQELTTLKSLDSQRYAESGVSLDEKTYTANVNRINENLKILSESLGLNEEQLQEIRDNVVGTSLPSPEEEAALAQKMNPPSPEAQPATSSTYSQEDLEFTAKKYGISVEDVKKRLGTKG